MHERDHAEPDQHALLARLGQPRADARSRARSPASTVPMLMNVAVTRWAACQRRDTGPAAAPGGARATAGELRLGREAVTLGAGRVSGRGERERPAESRAVSARRIVAARRRPSDVLVDGGNVGPLLVRPSSPIRRLPTTRSTALTALPSRALTFAGAAAAGAAAAPPPPLRQTARACAAARTPPTGGRWRPARA